MIRYKNGDIIGILGCRGTTTSYGIGPYSTTIDGYPVTLTRMGMQYQLPTTPAQDIWQETGYIGRVEITYEYYPVFVTSMKTAFIIFAVLCFGGMFASLARGKAKKV